MKKVYLAVAAILVLMIHFIVSFFTGDDVKLISTYYFGDNTDYEYPAEVVRNERGLVVAGRTELIFFDFKGNLLWKKPLYALGSLCASFDSNIGICERNSGEFYILSSDGEILHHSDQYGKIRKLKAYSRNSFAFQTDYGIHIYSGSADKLYFLPSQQGDIIDFAYSDLHKKFAVLYLDSEVNCYINLLTVTGETTSGKIEQEGLMFGVSLDDKKISVLRNDGVYEYDYFLEQQQEDQEEEAARVPNEVYSYQFDEGLLCAKSEGSYGLWKGNEKVFSLNVPVKSAFEMGDGYLIRDSEAVLCNSSGTKIKTIADAEDMIDVMKLSDRAFVIVYANRIEFYNR